MDPRGACGCSKSVLVGRVGVLVRIVEPNGSGIIFYMVSTCVPIQNIRKYVSFTFINDEISYLHAAHIFH